MTDDSPDRQALRDLAGHWRHVARKHSPELRREARRAAHDLLEALSGDPSFTPQDLATRMWSGHPSTSMRRRALELIEVLEEEPYDG